MATRWHEDDLTGRLLRAAASGEGQPVRRLRMPAIAEDADMLGREPGEPLWPEMWPLARLQERERAVSLYWWLAMYQQRPTLHGKTAWPQAYFEESIWADDWPDGFELFAIAIDPSKGKTERSDFSAIVGAGLARGKIWVRASIKRRPPSEIVSDAIRCAIQWGTDGIGFESNAFQELLAPEFDRQVAEQGLPPQPVYLVPNTINKHVRIERVAPYLARGHLRFERSEGCRLLVSQLREFPLADHDDGPDALEMALRLLNRLAGGTDEEHAGETAKA